MFESAVMAFGEMMTLDAAGLHITPTGRPLTRVIARHFDAYGLSATGHSSAV